MSGLEYLFDGFKAAVSIGNIVPCIIGVLVGTLVGVLPGLGPTATMSLMLPFTLYYGPAAGLIMMAGVWYGAQYGGSTTSVLVNIPGESSSVVTTLDGYQMAKKGRAGAALALVAGASWIAGTVGLIGLQLVAPALAGFVLAFGPSEYLALMIFALIILSNLTGSSPIKSYFMIALGLWLGTVGIDPMEGTARFTFGTDSLMSGIDFLPVAMGLFGISEILSTAADKYLPRVVKKIKLRELYPNASEIKRSVSPTIRGSILGFIVGLLPGPAPTIATFLSYGIEKRLSKTPQEFGKGMVEGVVGPEAANNSAVIGALIPLLVLGIPFAPPAAVLLAGLRMHDVNPGPFMFQQTPEIFWSFIASMYIGNVILLVLNLPLVGLFARIATLRAHVLMPIVCIISLVGVYSVRNSLFDVWVMVAVGVIGFFLRRLDFPVAALVIGLVLSPMLESSLRQTAISFKGQYLALLERPIVLFFLLLTIGYIAVNLRSRKKLSKLCA